MIGPEPSLGGSAPAFHGTFSERPACAAHRIQEATAAQRRVGRPGSSLTINRGDGTAQTVGTILPLGLLASTSLPLSKAQRNSWQDTPAIPARASATVLPGQIDSSPPGLNLGISMAGAGEQAPREGELAYCSWNGSLAGLGN
jgi:hypothetical protein